MPKSENREILNPPRLVVSKRLRRPPSQHDPEAECQLRYLDRHHPKLPHVVKFSGGRSSGMLLFTLLENDILNPERGDVIVFNNTSCEHPYTYDFVRDCKRSSEQYGVPFFLVEFQTYEDARNGEWTRIPAYRLVNDMPWSHDNPDGFRWKGEVFEELMSWAGFVPNQFSRICTKNMKLETTRHFLREWFAREDRVPHLGHFGREPRIDGRAMYTRHVRNRGGVPEDIYATKKAYGWSRPHFRPEQRYADFSKAWRPIENEWLAGKKLGSKAVFGEGGVEYVAFIGLRSDEPLRVSRVKERSAGPGASGYEGEHVYMPLSDMHVTKDDVNAFWDRQHWDLALPSAGSLSNCVYCFLKGATNLRNIHREMEAAKFEDDLPGYGSILETPCDIDWWKRIEKLYGRDLRAENREIRSDLPNDFLGFFGAGAGFTYDLLSGSDDTILDKFNDGLLPCECTE